MKGCLLLQRRFAYVGHAVARTLKERYRVSDFCGYVYLRSSFDFLQQQTDINYSSLLLDENVHEGYKQEKVDHEYLAWLEKEYGLPSLWSYLALDRVLMSSQLVREYPHDEPMFSHEDMLRILQAHAKAIIAMLDKERPDFLLCSVIGGVGSSLLYHICKKRGIKIFVIHNACIRDRWVLSEAFDRFTGVEKLMHEEREHLKQSPTWKEAEAYLESFRVKPIPYFQSSTPDSQPVTRRRQLKFLNPTIAFRSLRVWLKSVHEYFTGNDRDDYSYIGPWNYLRDLVKRKTRNLIGIEDLYDAIDPQEDIAFFPLHYEPEVSLLLLAPYYTDQLHLIKQIAKSLPVTYKLYVKEHPLMVEFRPRSFYRALKKIPNVKLIRPTVKGFEITRISKLILTITGSTAWDAALLGKPVIGFGHWFYNALSFVKYCAEIERLPELVKEQLQNFRYNEEELIAMIAAIFEESATVDLYKSWTETNDQDQRKAELEPMAHLLAKKLKLL